LQLAYDAARKAAVAVLAVQGLRGTTRGGHKVICEAVQAQFEDAFKNLDRLRRRRHAAEYPDLDTPDTTVDEAQHAIEQSKVMVEGADGLLRSGRLGVFQPSPPPR
jgi:hypothetical protein